MQAIILNQHGGAEAVAIASYPTPKSPELIFADSKPLPAALVRLHYGALNHLDLFVRQGWPGLKLRFPHILGSDGAGEIVELPKRLPSHIKKRFGRQLKVGSKVVINPGISCGNCEFCKAGDAALCVRLTILGEHINGTFCEYLWVPLDYLHLLPQHLSLAEGAAFPLTYLTAWRMLFSKAKIKKNETVLIHGIGGGVALAALQLCKAVGCHVWVTSRSNEKLLAAKKLGADEGLQLPNNEFARLIREKTNKRGIDVVVDCVGQLTWPLSLAILRRGGRLVTCGATTGPLAETDLNRVFWNQLQIFGSTMGNQKEFAEMLTFLKKHKLKPVIDKILPMTEAATALDRLEKNQQMGKILLKLSAV